MPASNAKRFGAVRLIISLTDGLAALALLSMMGIAFFDVVGRSFFQSPMPGATELTELAVAITIACVFPSLAWRGLHATIDVLDVFVPEWFRPWQVGFSNLLCAVSFAFVAWRVWIEGDKTARFGGQTPLLEIPMAPVLYGIAVLFGISALAFLFAILNPYKVAEA